MNNKQFRSLLASEPQSASSTTSSTSRAVLGGRRHGHATSSATSDTSFAQSVRERSKFLKPKKQFKTSDPRGSKIASGYVDRARVRAENNRDGNPGDEKAERIKELEEQFKHGKISQDAFEAARDAITAGDISSTHLVKGLDRRLLQRVRQGENVMGAHLPQTAEDDEVDDELDKIEITETQRIQREPRSVKQGQLASNLAAGKKRTRDEIMAELKARRKGDSTDVKAPPTLDDRWTRVNDKQRSRIETDRKGREILVILDEEGNVVKKLRKPASAQNVRKRDQVVGRDLPGEVLGADIKLPGQSSSKQDEQKAERDDVAVDNGNNNDDDDADDIFEGVGTDYDPLGSDGDESGDADDSDEEESPHHRRDRRSPTETDLSTHSMQPSSTSATTADPSTTRNYFNDKHVEADNFAHDHLKGVEAMIAKAARLASEQQDKPTEHDDGDKAAAARRAKHAAMLNTRDRDMDDLDLGFGGSRFEDGDDEDTGKRQKLTEWSDVKRDDKSKGRRDKGRA